MGKRSRDKGKRGEREAAKELERLFGVECRRGVQFCGGPESPDVVADIPGVHFEVKRAERLSLYAALDQAAKDGDKSIPVVLHRANGKDWVVIHRLEDWPALAVKLYLLKSAQ